MLIVAVHPNHVKEDDPGLVADPQLADQVVLAEAGQIIPVEQAGQIVFVLLVRGDIVDFDRLGVDFIVADIQVVDKEQVLAGKILPVQMQQNSLVAFGQLDPAGQELLLGRKHICGDIADVTQVDQQVFPA